MRATTAGCAPLADAVSEYHDLSIGCQGERIGQQLRAGGALLEISKVRGPCMALDVYGPAIKQEIYDQQVNAGDPASPRWGRSGFYARVIKPGPVHPEDFISVLATLA
jgi:MOSC domain-containing protein YiiM